jgi:quinol-cytochrome oxidoreductase complex cytochrome b subunit
VLPGLLIILLFVHIWRVRKDGFAVTRPSSGAFVEHATVPPGTPAAIPSTHDEPSNHDGPAQRVRLLGVVDRESVTAEERPTDDTVFAWPHLLVRHVVVFLGVSAVVLALGVAFAAPLKSIANPNLTPEPAKAPWYFAGLQELLSHFDPLVAGILVPAGAVIGLTVLPYLDRNPATSARHRKVAIVVFVTLATLAVGLTVIGTFFRGPGWRFVAPWDHLYLEL